MQDGFAEQARRLDGIEARQAVVEHRTDAMHAKIEHFDEVVNRLDGLAESLETVSGFVRRGKRAWAKSAGFIGGILLVVDVIAHSLPRLHWNWFW